MGLIVYAKEAYARQLLKLFPRGRAWRRDSDSVWYRVMLASGTEMSRVNQRASDLVEESDPRTTVELLPEHEEELGLPSDGTIAERQARVVARLIRRQRARPVDFQEALAPILGLDPEDIQVIEHSRAYAILVGDDRAIFQFYIFRDPALGGTYNVSDAQDLVDDTAQSHTVGKVIESITFKCDDPFSLCDRDLLGE